MFIATWFVVAETQEIAQCPSPEEGTNKPWYIYMTNKAIAMSKLGVKILTWLNLKDIMLGEK